MDKLVCIANCISNFPGRYRTDNKVLCCRVQQEGYELFKQKPFMLKEIVSKLQEVQNVDPEEKSYEVAKALYQYGKSLCEIYKHRQVIFPFEKAIMRANENMATT